MKLSKLRIENFRSFKDETIYFDDYTCLVGAKGCLKILMIDSFLLISAVFLLCEVWIVVLKGLILRIGVCWNTKIGMIGLKELSHHLIFINCWVVKG